MRLNIKAVYIVLALLMCSLFTLSKGVFAAVDLSDPYQKTEITATKLFKTMTAESAKIKQNPEVLKQIVTADLLPEIHVKYAGALVLGNEYQKLTPNQRDRYFAAFQDYLVQAFAQALSMYSDQSYQIEKPSPIGDKTFLSVRVLLVAKNQQPIRLDFQWRKNTKTGEWQAYDMIAEGMSMITTKQSEWATTLRTGGIEALIKMLQEQSKVKIDPNAPKPTAPATHS